MGRVIDYAWGRPSIASLRAAGAVAVCRYLSYDTTGKNLSADEVAKLKAGGIDIVSNWEYAGSWAEYSGGSAAGARHARDAQQQHAACGGPPSRPIYFSTDFNPLSSQLLTIANYYRGVADVIGFDRTGAYGGYSTIKYLFDAGVITWGWQTYAWSNGQWDTRAQLRQIRNGVPIGGVDCDLNDSQVADFGQWGVGDMGITESAYNADSNGWAVRTGATSKVYPGGQPGTPVDYGNPLWDLLRGLVASQAALGAKLDTIAAKVDIDPEELAAIAAAAREGAASGALGPSAAEIVTELLTRLSASSDLTPADIEAAVQAALRAGTDPRP